LAQRTFSHGGSGRRVGKFEGDRFCASDALRKDFRVVVPLAVNTAHVAPSRDRNARRF
jgi:hypothetical protein